VTICQIWNFFPKIGKLVQFTPGKENPEFFFPICFSEEMIKFVIWMKKEAFE
jgi:hypothetical protein